MINLLPVNRQKKLRLEEMSKIAAILGIVVVAAFLAFILILALIRDFYQVQLKSAQIDMAEKEREMEIFGVKGIEGRIVGSNGLISKISDFYAKQIKITGIISQAAESLPPGMSLSGFVYSPGMIQLSGFAPDRDSLVVFKNNLAARPGFSDVVFSSQDWLAAQNINFNVSIHYAKH